MKILLLDVQLPLRCSFVVTHVDIAFSVQMQWIVCLYYIALLPVHHLLGDVESTKVLEYSLHVVISLPSENEDI